MQGTVSVRASSRSNHLLTTTCLVNLKYERAKQSQIVDKEETFIHSFIPNIYIAPLQETYSEALSVQLRSKRNVLGSLQKEDMLLQTAPDAPLDVEQTDTKRDTKRETNRQTHTERKKVRVRERERETDRQRERERDSTTPISLTFL